MSHDWKNIFSNRHIIYFKYAIWHPNFCLGIWAAEEESDEEEIRGSKYSKSKNYTAPVNFIAGGVHQPGKKEPEKKEENKDEKDDVEILSDSSE